MIGALVAPGRPAAGSTVGACFDGIASLTLRGSVWERRPSRSTDSAR